MEYTDYYVVKGAVKDVRKKLAKLTKRGLIVDEAKSTFVPFVIAGKTDKLPKNFDWLLRVFDAEGSAWGFNLWIAGKEVASATYGDNGASTPTTTASKVTKRRRPRYSAPRRPSSRSV